VPHSVPNPTASLSAPRDNISRWATAIRARAARSIQVVRSWASTLGRRLRALTPEQWFFLGFTLLLAAFLAVLFFQPSSVGRGGR